MKQIVIACDGTWNAPDQSLGGIPVPTNVARLAKAVWLSEVDPASDGIRRQLYYDVGVGTSGNCLRRFFDGATGYGLSQNLLRAYRYLINNYEPGDELFFFGFSRGAFTVRSLAGLIRNCGILRRDAIEVVDRAYEFYRSRSPSTEPKENEAILFRRTYAAAEETPIKFIGVWDTVGALGNPLLLKSVYRITTPRYEFHDTCLSSTVEHAYQALAIDEKRRHFQPALWHQQQSGIDAGQTLEQIWFAGVHANIGGGYASTGLSDISLQWMAEKALNCGLLLKPFKEPLDANPYERCEESRKGLYRLVPKYHRPISKPQAIKNKSTDGPTNERLDSSVLQRYFAEPGANEDGPYRPPNLVDYLKRFPDVQNIHLRDRH